MHAFFFFQRTFNLCLCDGEYLSKDNNQEQIIGLDFLQDQESLCIVTSKGDVLLWQPELDSLENVGCVEAGFTCSEWSPGQELLVLTTSLWFFVSMLFLTMFRLKKEKTMH